mmetsp:Transcript_26299/g.58878  ORF Transcript_26299/g.58878 Transcript_26299/m.58878 type:complete len:309 (+) Transcript_26299:18-944(+)
MLLKRTRALTGLAGGPHKPKSQCFGGRRHTSLWSGYSTALQKHPIFVKAVSSGLICGSGDAACQTVQQWLTPPETAKADFDVRRTLRFTALGAGLLAPTLHVWYATLSKWFPGSTAAAAAKVACYECGHRTLASMDSHDPKTVRFSPTIRSVFPVLSENCIRPTTLCSALHTVLHVQSAGLGRRHCEHTFAAAHFLGRNRAGQLGGVDSSAAYQLQIRALELPGFVRQLRWLWLEYDPVLSSNEANERALLSSLHHAPKPLKMVCLINACQVQNKVWPAGPLKIRKTYSLGEFFLQKPRSVSVLNFNF